MNYEIILVAVALAMDAFAVALSSGMTIPRVKLIHALKIGGVFGLFQGVMPVIGYLGGTLFAKQISAIDHWVAFVLLAIIGGKMIHEAFEKDDDEEPKDPLKWSVLLPLAVATSIDALAVGVTFPALNVPLFMGVAIIGVITFGISGAGVLMGHRFGHKLGERAELFGGVVLIAIGIKILVSHLTGA